MNGLASESPGVLPDTAGRIILWSSGLEPSSAPGDSISRGKAMDDEVPPLRQSTELVMGCPKFYVVSVIQKQKQPGGLESARGTQVHRVLGQYASWCATKDVKQDLTAFDHLAKGVGPQAERILSGLRDSYVVDSAHLLGTEVSMALDEQYQPTNVSLTLEEFCEDSGLPSCYEGTLDALYLFRNERRIDIDDAKSHAKPFDPNDTLQGKMYSLFCFQHFSWVQEIRFRLVFVRYRNLTRQITYHRSDIPMLIEVISAARARQEMIHKDYAVHKETEAIPGAHCCYCPLLSNRNCPIAEFNPQMQLTPEDWLKWDLWNQAFSRVNKARMKDRVQSTGRPIVLRDYNGKKYVYGPEDKETTVYPLFQATADGIVVDGDGNPAMPIVSLLMDYWSDETNADDREWLGKLLISSSKLESYLSANKRVHVHQAIQDTADKITRVKMKVSNPADAVDLSNDELYDEEEWNDEEEF